MGQWLKITFVPIDSGGEVAFPLKKLDQLSLAFSYVIHQFKAHYEP